MSNWTSTTATVGTTYTDVATVDVRDTTSNRLTLVFQANNATACDFRVLGQATSDDDVAIRGVPVVEFLSRTSSSDPDALITEHEFRKYTVQARAASSTASVTVQSRLYDTQEDDD